MSQWRSDSHGIMFIPRFVKIYQVVQKLKGGTNTKSNSKVISKA